MPTMEQSYYTGVRHPLPVQMRQFGAKAKTNSANGKSFMGRAVKDGKSFELYDPMKGIKTYDFGGQPIESGELPGNPISVNGPKAEFAGMAGAVSAHFHAKLVDDFLRKVL